MSAPEVHALLLCPGESGDAIQTLVVAAQLHRRGALRLCAVVACGGPNRERGALVMMRVLKRLGVNVPVGVGSATDENGLSWSDPPDLILENDERTLAAELCDGCELLERVLDGAEPHSLTVVCAAGMSDLAAAIKADPERAHAKLVEVSIQGGLERAADRRGWLPDNACNNLADEAAAAFVYSFCLEKQVPLAVVSRHAVPAVPLQLAYSFAARSADPLPAYIAKAQHDSLCALWRRVNAHDGSLPERCDATWFLDTFCPAATASARQEAEAAAAEGRALDPALLAGAAVRPYSLIALLAVAPAFRLLMPESQAMVEGPHRFYLRGRHMLDVSHVLKVLRDSFHEAIILAHEAAAPRAAPAGHVGQVGGALNAFLGALFPTPRGGPGGASPRASPAARDRLVPGLGASSSAGSRTVDPTRAEHRLRDAGIARFVTRAFRSGGAAPPTSILHGSSNQHGASDAGTETRTAADSVESWVEGAPVRTLGPLGGEEAELVELARSASDEEQEQEQTAADEAAYADLDATGHAGDEGFALDEFADSDDEQLGAGARRRAPTLVELFDAALAQAAARQWRLSVPLLVMACVLLGCSAHAQLAVQIKPGWESTNDATALLRADTFAVVYLAAAVALMLALQPTRSFLGLVRIAAQALATLYASALVISTRTFALRFVAARGAQHEAMRTVEAGHDVGAQAMLLVEAVGWEPLLVLPMLAGSLGAICRALWRHGKEVTALSYCLFLTVGVASLGEVCGVLAKRAMLGWLLGGRGPTVALATVLRTLVKGALSSLLLWPRFRSVAHGLLASALTSIGAAAQPLAPLAPLLGFGSATVAQPAELVAAARAALRPVRVGDGDAASGECGELELQKLFEGAQPPQPAQPQAEGGVPEPAYFVVHSAGDCAADKASALARWAREQAEVPQLVIDPVPATCAGGDAAAPPSEESLALAVASLGLCKRLIVLAGPSLTDSLWAVALLHAWTCLGRSVDDATLLLAVRTSKDRRDAVAAAAAAAAGRSVLEAFDAFAVMYARADSEGDDSAAASSAAQLTLSVELATASAYNECVRACVPLVHAQLVKLETAAERAKVGSPPPSAGRYAASLRAVGEEEPSAALAPPPPVSRSSSGSSARSDEEPTFLRHLRLSGAAQALVAAFGKRHATPVSGPFVPLPMGRANAEAARAARAGSACAVPAAADGEAADMLPPAGIGMPAAGFAPHVRRREFEPMWAQYPLSQALYAMAF